MKTFYSRNARLQHEKVWGTERISSEDWQPHRALWDIDEWTLAPSDYGDPEEALIQGPPTEAVEAEQFAHLQTPEFQEIETCMGLLNPLDRIIMYLWLERGWKQTELAEMMGLSQPTISARIKRVETWIALVVPVRIDMADMIRPWEWDEFPNRQWIWDGVMWRHRALLQLAQDKYASFGACYAVWRRVIRDVRKSNPRKKTSLEVLGKSLSRWMSPRADCRARSSFVDSIMQADDARFLPPVQAWEHRADPELLEIARTLDAIK